MSRSLIRQRSDRVSSLSGNPPEPRYVSSAPSYGCTGGFGRARVVAST